MPSFYTTTSFQLGLRNLIHTRLTRELYFRFWWRQLFLSKLFPKVKISDGTKVTKGRFSISIILTLMKTPKCEKN